jgi:hypothetical protein
MAEGLVHAVLDGGAPRLWEDWRETHDIRFALATALTGALGFPDWREIPDEWYLPEDARHDQVPESSPTECPS